MNKSFNCDEWIDVNDQLQKRLLRIQSGSDESAGFEPDPIFPVALRITVELFDDAGRLERPIRHVMVIPVGE